MKQFVAVLLATTFLTTGTAFAEDAILAPVVVTATRHAEELASVPAAVTVISKTDIEQSAANTVPELLRNIPGVLVNDISGSKRYYTVDLRGFGETAALNTLVMVDGRRINQADLSGVDWTLIPLEQVERIEIVRGGRGSIMYGDNAAGGTINIITKGGVKEPLINTALSLGSYKTFQASVAATGTMDNLSLTLNSNYLTSDGYRDNSDSISKNLGMGINYDATEKLSLRLKTGYHWDDTHLPGALSQSDLASGVPRTATLSPDDFTKIEDWYLQGGSTLYLSGDSYVDLGLSTRSRSTDFFSFFSAGTYTGATDIKTFAVAPKVIINEPLWGHTSQLVLGTDFEKNTENLRNASVFFGSPSVASYKLRKISRGYYGHAEISLTDSLAVSGGLRRDQADFSFTSKDSGALESTGFDEALYTVGLTYRLAEDSSVYASYAKSYRYPVLDEMYSFFSNTLNKGLSPQTADDIEIGLRQQINSNLSVTANLFRIETKDEIFYNPYSFANENLDGHSIRQGIELSVKQRVRSVLLTGSYTYRDSEIDGGQFDGNNVPNVPQHQLTLGMQTDIFHNVQLNLDGNYIGKRQFISDFDNSHDKQDEYYYLAGKLTYLLARGSVYLAVKNLLDQKYSEYGVIDWAGEKNFYPSPGINFQLGANWHF